MVRACAPAMLVAGLLVLAPAARAEAGLKEFQKAMPKCKVVS